MSGLRSRISRVQELTREEISRWHDLMRQSPFLQSPFLSATFAAAADRAFDRVYVATILSGGEAQGFFPFQFPSATHRRLGWAERVGGELSDSFGIIADRALRLSAAELLKLCGLTSLYFTHLPAAQTEFGIPGEQPELGLRIEFPRGPAQYWAELRRADSKFVSDTERRVRKISEKFGPLNLVFRHASPAQPLDELIAAKRAQYGRTGAADCFADPRARQLLHILSESGDPNCSGVLSTLHSGDQWVGSHFGLIYGTTLHYWFPVYNPDIHAYSPGRLLVKALIDASAETGLQAIDRGAGDSAAKRDFANAERTYLRGVWVRPGVRALARRAMMSVHWRLQSGASPRT